MGSEAIAQTVDSGDRGQSLSHGPATTPRNPVSRSQHWTRRLLSNPAASPDLADELEAAVCELGKIIDCVFCCFIKRISVAPKSRPS